MQKTTYYDNSTLFGGYSYQGANGFGYEAPQQNFQASAHLESDYQRSACSLQSLGGGGGAPPHAKGKVVSAALLAIGRAKQFTYARSVVGRTSLNKRHCYEEATTNIKGLSETMHSISVCSNYLLFHFHPAESCGGEKSPPGSAASKRARTAYTSAQSSAGFMHSMTGGYDAPSPPAFNKPHQNAYSVSTAYQNPMKSCPSQQKYANTAPEYDPHGLQGNGNSYGTPNIQGSPVYVGGNYVDSMTGSAPSLYGLNHMPHHQANSMDYNGAGQMPPAQHHGPCDPHPTYTDLSAHHPPPGRLQEAPKLTHL
ncbi:HXB3A protein, partial [Atractosteus spatula]|nr:HXB3A protein [Atractosteus spatula]